MKNENFLQDMHPTIITGRQPRQHYLYIYSNYLSKDVQRIVFLVITFFFHNFAFAFGNVLSFLSLFVSCLVAFSLSYSQLFVYCVTLPLLLVVFFMFDLCSSHMLLLLAFLIIYCLFDVLAFYLPFTYSFFNFNSFLSLRLFSADFQFCGYLFSLFCIILAVVFMVCISPTFNTFVA